MMVNVICAILVVIWQDSIFMIKNFWDASLGGDADERIIFTMLNFCVQFVAIKKSYNKKRFKKKTVYKNK